MKKKLLSTLRRALGTQQILDQVRLSPGLVAQASPPLPMPAEFKDQADSIMTALRREYTVMPRFGFHQPLDYHEVSLPPIYSPVEICNETGMAIPTAGDRFGYSPDSTQEYLKWGKFDHDLIMEVIEKYKGPVVNASILDFGCSSGRVLRHFEKEVRSSGWRPFGCDVQARAVEWMRLHLPLHYNVISSSVLPHLPYEDNTFDCIYGFSVFTHIKYQWEAWLMELRRILKPGGLLVQTIHTESAWEHYHLHRKEDWVRNGHCARMYDVEKMDVDYLLHGDVGVSQVFWKKEVAVKYWGRYLTVLERRDPPKYSFQDWMICRK
jgi:SAM-dependent methyltransferase